MLSIKTAVSTALTSSVTLTSYVGNNIYFQYPSNFINDNLPAVSFFELDNIEGLHADNQEIASEIFFQVDVWSKSSTTIIAKEIDVIMKSLDFSRISAPDFFENDTKIHHKAMTYRLDLEDNTL